MSNITQDQLKKILNYNSETGVFIWLHRGRDQFSSDLNCSMFNSRYSGKEAGSINTKGYMKITIAPNLHSAHRLAWLYVYGELPDGQIDHINGDKTDNKISNLRCVSNEINCKNQSLAKNNTTGILGVHFSSTSRRWIARINAGGNRQYLGCFSTLLDACSARKSAEMQHGYHENHGRVNW